NASQHAGVAVERYFLLTVRIDDSKASVSEFCRIGLRDLRLTLFHSRFELVNLRALVGCISNLRNTSRPVRALFTRVGVVIRRRNFTKLFNIRSVTQYGN